MKLCGFEVGLDRPFFLIAGPCVIESLELIASGEAWGGMAVKLNAALAAVDAGIGRVRIGGLGTLTDNAAGTTVHAMVEVAA